MELSHILLSGSDEQTSEELPSKVNDIYCLHNAWSSAVLEAGRTRCPQLRGIEETTRLPLERFEC